MNTMLSTTLGRHDHPPQPTGEQPQHPVRRVSLLDRAALHLGVALIAWGRRPLAAAARALVARRPADPLPLFGALFAPLFSRGRTLLSAALGGGAYAQQHISRSDREWAAEKWFRLNLPRL